MRLSKIEKIARFRREDVPADIYGVGSSLMAGEPNDFTADVVRVKLADKWLDLAKTGRKPLPNPDLEAVI